MGREYGSVKGVWVVVVVRVKSSCRLSVVSVGAVRAQDDTQIENIGTNSVSKIRTSDGGLRRVSRRKLPGLRCLDGANVWVTNFGDNTVSKLRARDGANLGTFATGTDPWGIAFDGTSIWVGNILDCTVSKFRPGDGAVLGVFPSGHFPISMSFDGSNLWIIHAENDYSLSAGKVLDARREHIGKQHRLKIDPPIGHTVDDGHDFLYLSVNIWEPDVFAFSIRKHAEVSLPGTDGTPQVIHMLD